VSEPSLRDIAIAQAVSDETAFYGSPPNEAGQALIERTVDATLSVIHTQRDNIEQAVCAALADEAVGLTGADADALAVIAADAVLAMLRDGDAA
jgi:hypothetical protein